MATTAAPPKRAPRATAAVWWAPAPGEAVPDAVPLAVASEACEAARLEADAIAEEAAADSSELVAEERAWLRELCSAAAEEVMEPRRDEASPAMEEAAPEALLRISEAPDSRALEAEPMMELSSEAPGTAGVVGVGTIGVVSWAF